MKNNKHLIFVTGLPRSGSTWASRAISKGTQSHLIHEPFNWLQFPERIDYHMKYLPSGSHDFELIRILLDTMKSSFDYSGDNPCIVVKDVHICLAVEYVWEKLKPWIILIIRHPCAMAYSWVRLNLEVVFRIDNLFSQPKLVEDYLQPYKSHINKKRENFFYSFGAYWGISYFILDKLASLHSDWKWINHDIFCQNPIHQFIPLLTYLGANQNSNSRGIKSLKRYLCLSNRFIRRDKNFFRLTKNEPHKWKTHLTSTQIMDVLAGAEPFGLIEKYFGDPVAEKKQG